MKGLTVLFLSIICFCISVAAVDKKAENVFENLPVSGKTIIIDAGHGGWDPGKVSASVEEKDINLLIAKRIEEYLSSSGAEVIMTRDSDTALGNTKNEDMKKRISIAKDDSADLFLSIHQNSFPQSSIKGAQVFYFKDSEEGKDLAEKIQNRLKTFADETNTRMAKDNNNYYILKNTEAAAVIIECGFLSNPEEEKKLKDNKYRDKIAWAVYMGIWDFFDNQNFT